MLCLIKVGGENVSPLRDEMDFRIVRIWYKSVDTRTDWIEDSFLGGLQRPSLEQCLSSLRDGQPCPPTGLQRVGCLINPQLRSSFTTKESAVPGMACHSFLWPCCPAQARRVVGVVLEEIRGGQDGRGGRGRLEHLRGGRQVASSSRGGFPTVYNTSCFSLSLSLFSLSLFPVSPALPFPPPLSYLCLRPASGPRGLCFTPLVAHRAEEAADPWYNTAWLGWLGTLLQEAAGMD